jgi:hypothetical protein
VLLLSSEAELPPADRVWGTGGWVPPEQREALDWLTLARLLGWAVAVTHPSDHRHELVEGDAPPWILVACDPDALDASVAARLASRLATEPVLVVARAGSAGSPLARLAGAARLPERSSGQRLSCVAAGSESDWVCRKEIEAGRLELSEGTAIWATLNGAPVIAARAVGRGTVATLGFHPSQARDADGAATALLVHLLTHAASVPVAWFDWSGCLVLRMDDPGGAQNVHSRTWSYPKLGESEWASIRADLRRRKARMSLGYVAGWVDDGDLDRGELEVDGRKPDRKPGEVHPSPLVRYRDRSGHRPATAHDYRSEYRGIQTLRAEGLGDVELHGYTHMHPDTRAWAKAGDRYESWPATSWYREFGQAAQPFLSTISADEHPLSRGVAAFRRYFQTRPTTLICPGDQWTTSTLEHALDLGLLLVSSYYLAIRDGERFCWTTHTCAPYLNEPDAAWFAAGLPVVGYFHDYEPATEGVDWVSHWLDQWQSLGARRLIDFRELASALNRRLVLSERAGYQQLTVTGPETLPLVRPLSVLLRTHGDRLPARLTLCLDGRQHSVRVDPLRKGVGRVTLPGNMGRIEAEEG